MRLMRLQRKENIKNCTKTLFVQAVNYSFHVCVTVHLRYNNINNQPDATITIY